MLYIAHPPFSPVSDISSARSVRVRVDCTPVATRRLLFAVLEVGNPGLNVPEARSHFALWCLIKSPLLIGCDLRTINDSFLEILTNAELIAISQDSLGIPGWLRNSTVGSDPAYRIPLPQELVDYYDQNKQGTGTTASLLPPPPPLPGPFGGIAVCELESSQGISASQRWVVNPAAGTISQGGKCLTLSAQGGTKVSSVACDGSALQQWEGLELLNQTLIGERARRQFSSHTTLIFVSVD